MTSAFIQHHLCPGSSSHLFILRFLFLAGAALVVTAWYFYRRTTTVSASAQSPESTLLRQQNETALIAKMYADVTMLRKAADAQKGRELKKLRERLEYTRKAKRDSEFKAFTDRLIAQAEIQSLRKELEVMKAERGSTTKESRADEKIDEANTGSVDRASTPSDSMCAVERKEMAGVAATVEVVGEAVERASAGSESAVGATVASGSTGRKDVGIQVVESTNASVLCARVVGKADMSMSLSEFNTSSATPAKLGHAADTATSSNTVLTPTSIPSNPDVDDEDWDGEMNMSLSDCYISEATPKKVVELSLRDQVRALHAMTPKKSYPDPLSSPSSPGLSSTSDIDIAERSSEKSMEVEFSAEEQEVEGPGTPPKKPLVGGIDSPAPFASLSLDESAIPTPVPEIPTRRREIVRRKLLPMPDVEATPSSPLLYDFKPGAVLGRDYAPFSSTVTFGGVVISTETPIPAETPISAVPRQLLSTPILHTPSPLRTEVLADDEASPTDAYNETTPTTIKAPSLKHFSPVFFVHQDSPSASTASPGICITPTPRQVQRRKKLEMVPVRLPLWPAGKPNFVEPLEMQGAMFSHLRATKRWRVGPREDGATRKAGVGILKERN